MESECLSSLCEPGAEAAKTLDISREDRLCVIVEPVSSPGVCKPDVQIPTSPNRLVDD